MAARARRPPVPDPAPIAAPPALPDPGAYRLDQLGSLCCRFICSGEGEGARFCGQPTTRSRSNKHGSWCAEHLAIVFVPWQRGGSGGSGGRKGEGA